MKYEENYHAERFPSGSHKLSTKRGRSIVTEKNIEKQILRAGLFFTMSIWVQSQMVFLIALYENNEQRNKYKENTKIIPKEIIARRKDLMKKSFNSILDLFKDIFTIDQQFLADIYTVKNYRDFIAHSYISLGKDYFLYTPSSRKRLESIQSTMKILQPSNGESDFSGDTFKINFVGEVFDHNYEAIIRLNKCHFDKIGKGMGLSRNEVR